MKKHAALFLLACLCLLGALLPIACAGAGQAASPDPGPDPRLKAGLCGRLYILMYHNLVPAAGEEDCNAWTVTDRRLRQDLEWLRDNGYTTVLPRDLVSGEPLPERAVMITFDDGYRSNYELAFPLLKEFGAKAVISIITKCLTDRSEYFVTWDMCREMADSGLVEIGSHTNGMHRGEHGILRRENETRADYEARVTLDLDTSIGLIRENVGEEPVFFAYPNGSTEEWAGEIIRERFAVTVTTDRGLARLDRGLYGLPRFNVSMESPVELLLP